MKAISIRQPWAWAIFHAGKDIENRSWSTSHRGALAIHATSLERGYALPPGVAAPPPDELTFRAVIGVVEIVDVVNRSDSVWFRGPRGLVLRRPRLLPRPIPCRGDLHVWQLPAAVARAVAAQLKAAETHAAPVTATSAGAREVRTLRVTQGNLDNHHLYLTAAMDLFPADSLGGSNRQGAARPVRVHCNAGTIETDIVQARRMFRRRAWLGRFFALNRVRAGDYVLLERLSPYDFHLSVASRQQHR